MDMAYTLLAFSRGRNLRLAVLTNIGAPECEVNSTAIMASEDALFEAVRENLHRSGKLDKIKAELRAEIMKVLEPTCNLNTKPEIPSETLVINELIREFLTWNGYHYTTSVFVAESGMPAEPCDRVSLTRIVGGVDNERTSKLPLLYSMVSTFKGMVQQL